MAETLISPGVLARENDQSFLTRLPVQAGAAIIGPTARGPINVPTLVTTYSEYVSVFGDIIEFGEDDDIDNYTTLTSISAFNHFQQGGNSLLVTRVVNEASSWTPATAGLGDGGDTLTLETLSLGKDQNSGDTENDDGVLVDGTKYNVRWEVVSKNDDKGTFTLIIRRGDDNTKSKKILETFTNLSLDPNEPNYVEKVIGNQFKEVKNGGGDSYVATTGEYPNMSQYVRVKVVNKKLLNFKTGDTFPMNVGKGGFTGGGGEPESFNAYDQIAEDTQTVTASDYETAIHLLKNKDEYQYNVLTTPGLIHEEEEHAKQMNTIISNCESRGDCLYVLDLVKHGGKEGTSMEVVKKAVKEGAFDSSYAATYWPWLQTGDPSLGRTVWVPASTMMLGVYAFNDKSAEAWFAPAGLNRGGLTTVIQAEKKLTNSNRDELYDLNINPIATFPNTGVVVFGQKTLQKRASALDRINVRRLLIELKSFISQIADTLVFEQNTTATRNNFLTQVNPYLASVQQRQGLFAFKVVMDDSNNTPDVIDRNQLIGQIFVQPTKTAEFIYLDFNIQPTGATFND
tara:strand:+ start:9482 stop:11188 length:1707 start_codon:yes stop_codon:yes gene_type:complete